jgi:hypothetical protein
MNQTEYLTDSQKLIYMSSRHIVENMEYEQVVHSMTFFSFGIERLLKHILESVNPVFILKKSDFNNAAPCLYKDRFISTEKNDQISGNPDHDVITFRIAMQRALVFSKSVQKNKQLIFTLAHYRDIIAHRPTSEINLEKANRLLARDGISLVKDFCDEIDASPNSYFGEYRSRLEELSEKTKEKENFEQRMKTLLEDHLKLWIHRKTNEGFVSHAADITHSIFSSSGNDFSYEEFTCPACDNEAVARIEPDYDYDKAEGMSYIVGVFVDKIHCYYCGLELEDYEELNYVDANSVFEAYADYHEDGL